MQLHLGSKELNLIANLLMEHDDKSHAHEVVLKKVLVKDLAFDADQLEFLDEFLKGVQHNLRRSVDRHGDATANDDIAQTLCILEDAIEKVEEACATM